MSKVPLSEAQLKSRNDRVAASKRNDEILNAGASSVTGTTSDFRVYRYPLDLATSHHPHYIMFFITSRKTDVSGVEIAGSDTKELSFDQTQTNRLSKTTAAQAGYGAVLGAGAGISAGAKLEELAPAGPASGLVNVIRGGVIGAGAGAAVGALSDRTEVLLKDAIALYINKNPSVAYAASWADEDIGILGGASEQMKGANFNSVSGILDTTKKLMQGTGGAIASYVLQNASKDLGGLGSSAGAFSASAGVVANPFKAQLFKSMGFREFNYDYTFLPKSEAEYREVKQIIKTFKMYMHPTLGAEKFIMGYPAEFTIAYYYREGLNEELFRISNCALTNLQIDYGGTDFATFREGEFKGAPSEISIKLTFKELEVLSKERIEVGF